MKNNIQTGGWNEITFDNFRFKVSQENDTLKQTDTWWYDLKEELHFYAEEMSDTFMAESRFQGMAMGQVQDFLDIIILLLLDISIVYSSLLINQPKPQEMIEKLNNKSIRLRDVLNIDFVEFIQILLDFVKTTDKFTESNTLGYVDPRLIDTDYKIKLYDDFTTTEGIIRLARKIHQMQTSNYSSGHYAVYKDAVLDSVKLLDLFLLKAYTGEYGELQARSIVCKDYFFDSILNKKNIIGWVANYEYNSKKTTTVVSDMIESLDLLNPGETFLSKSEIKYGWKELYEKIKQMRHRTPHSNIKMRNLTQGDRVNWKEDMKKWKESFRLILYSSLVNRNDYSFSGKGLPEIDKDIFKEYEQFQVKLAVFYKRLLIEWIGFSSLEEYERADPDRYKDKLKVNRRFLDIIRCIEGELDRITDSIHPRNNDFSSDDESDDESDDGFEVSKLSSTRHVHLYHENIDFYEDSDDEFERIGSEYVEFLRDKTDETDYADTVKSLDDLGTENNPDNIPKKYFKNLGKLVSVKKNGSEFKFMDYDSIIIDVYEKPIVNDTENEIIKEYVYLIAVGGIRKPISAAMAFLQDSLYNQEYMEVVEFDVNDPIFDDDDVGKKETFRWNGHNFEKGDIVYYIEITSEYDKNKQRYVKYAFILEAEVLDKIFDGDILTHLKVEMADSDYQHILPIDDKKNVNLTKFGAIQNAIDRFMKEYGESEDRDFYLSRTFKEFKLLNEQGEPTYHLEYSKNRRGNPLLDTALRERGFDGMNYVKDSVEKMIDYNPDKKIEIKELETLRGKDTNIKYHKNLFPERIGYLEAIMEDDKEFETPVMPKKRWEPDNDEGVEEDFDGVRGQRRLEDILQRQRLGTSRPLQRDWYRQQRVNQKITGKQNIEDEYSTFQEIPSDLVEDNPIFKQGTVNRFIKRTLKNRYDVRSRSNLPARRHNLSEQLRQQYNVRRPNASEMSRQTDQRVEQRTIRNRRKARELEDKLLRQSRLINGRTPVQVMDLQNRINYRRNVSRSQSDNLVRQIDRERQTRLERMQ